MPQKRSAGIGEWQRLGGALVADSAKLMQAGWTPKLATREGLAALARESGSKND